MVGLADIPIVGTFVDKVSEYTVAAVFRGLKYMFCYKALVEQLNSETTKLNIEKGNMSRKVKEEKANGKEILGHVLDWQNDVEEIQKSTGKELSPSCSCIPRLPIPNPISRFQIGRNAAKMAQTVAEITGTGKSHLTGDIAQLPEFINMPNSNTIYEEFQSRKDVYKTLWDALVTENSPLTHGIYGMAGVGKTRIMEQFWDDAMEKNIFNAVVRVNVGSENMDKKKLQKQIAGLLDCKLESEEDVMRRASQLKNSLRNGGKILLILDDVWTEIHLDHIIGTPFADGSSSKGSKILLTSREKEVCLRNKCEHLVEIKTLTPDEALDLFKKAVGHDTINSLQDESLVKEVCDECGELPLLIHAVGKALQRKHKDSWVDARNQLKMGNIEKIAGENSYACIKLSINNLIHDAKLCLFFCCMFPEDAKMDMKILIQLATGSRLIPDGELRIPAMIEHLKTSSLLLNSGKYNEIKVHDVIRDVARHMASRESEYAFLHVKCNSGSFPSNVSVCTGKFLRLDVEASDVKFKENLVCPDLHTLWLQCNNHPQQFSGGFFIMFVNLSLLMLEKVNISLEQFSLQPLVNLGTLTLSLCDMSKTVVSPFPENLENLCIRYCDLPTPLDVANLKYLRKLEIQHRRYHELVMVPNVISSLSSLEELHIPNGFIINHKEHQKEPIVVEISKLIHLKSLQFHFYDDEYFQGTNVFSNLGAYDILVGEPEEFNRSEVDPFGYNSVVLNYRERYLGDSSTRLIGLFGNHWQCWKGLMVRAQKVRLGKSDFEMRLLGDIRAFEALKELCIEMCDKMEHLASSPHDEIQHSRLLTPGFSKLTILNITWCSKMKYLFCNNIARRLGQLQELSVKDCESMEAIIMNEGGTSNGDIIIFSKLKSLKLSRTPRLLGFYVEKRNIQLRSALSMDPSAQYQPLFDGMVAFPSLELLDIVNLEDISVIWGNECCNDTTLSSFCKLNHLRVSLCGKLKIVIPPAMLHRLNHLTQMIVGSCNEMREIIGVGEQAPTDGIVFPELTILKLSDLPSLTSFWCYQSGKVNTSKVQLRLPQLSSVVLGDLPRLKSFFYGVNFEFHIPALKILSVNDCGISTLFTFSMFRKFQLEDLWVWGCELLENIVEDSREDETCDKIITLSQLTRVALRRLPKLKSFFHDKNFEIHMPVIKEVKIYECGLSDTLFTRSVFENLKQLEELIVSDCELLEGIFEDARDAAGTSNKIIALDRVSLLHLEGLPKFKSIFHGANYECHMSGLKNVYIINCGLSTLFTCFREIQQLEELHVTNCELLECIVEEVGGDEASDTKSKSIKSFELSSITLESLPKLKSFSTSSYVFDMPKLQNVRLIKCPQIEYFSPSATKTSLVHVTSDWCSKEEFQDLDHFMRQNHNNRGSYLSDCAGEASDSSQDLGSQPEIFDEEYLNLFC